MNEVFDDVYGNPMSGRAASAGKDGADHPWEVEEIVGLLKEEAVVILR